jgi:hypothetical protein
MHIPGQQVASPRFSIAEYKKTKTLRRLEQLLAFRYITSPIIHILVNIVDNSESR